MYTISTLICTNFVIFFGARKTALIEHATVILVQVIYLIEKREFKFYYHLFIILNLYT